VPFCEVLQGAKAALLKRNGVDFNIPQLWNAPKRKYVQGISKKTRTQSWEQSPTMVLFVLFLADG
jgi:hypothetical protein